MKKPRQSNVELLRLLAMFMVLLLHAVKSFHWPQGGFLMSQPLVVHLGFSFVEMISIVAVWHSPYDAGIGEIFVPMRLLQSRC